MGWPRPATARALRWNGSHWAAGKSFGAEIGGAVVVSRSDVWVFGEPFAPGGGLGTWHYNGHAWSKVAEGSYGVGTSPLQQVSSDGHGGVWIPMPASGAERSYLAHYSAGHLTSAALPAGPRKINVESVASIPGGTGLLAGGFTHASDNPGAGVVAVILEYGS